MPVPAAEMVPELKMPPEKLATLTDVAFLEASWPIMALPPTQTPTPPPPVEEIVPELLIPPAKVEIVIEALPVSSPLPVLALPPTRMP
jgi:hypothetical protein